MARADNNKNAMILANNARKCYDPSKYRQNKIICFKKIVLMR